MQSGNINKGYIYGKKIIQNKNYTEKKEEIYIERRHIYNKEIYRKIITQKKKEI